MDKQELRKELMELHERMEAAIHQEPLDRDKLGRLMTDIVRISQGEELDDIDPDTLREHIEDQAVGFEAKHPRLAGIMRDIMDVLGRLGI